MSAIILPSMPYVSVSMKKNLSLLIMDFSKDELNHISQTYSQQFEGMKKQISFARQMAYEYKNRLRQVLNDDLVDYAVADICRQFLKFYDMGDRLDNDSRLVLDEKRQIDAYIESIKM